jgi:hypothetical protein
LLVRAARNHGRRLVAYRDHENYQKEYQENHQEFEQIRPEVLLRLKTLVFQPNPFLSLHSSKHLFTMSTITAPCWACQSSDETRQETCRVCSTSSKRKARISKPRNAVRRNRLPTISVDALLHLHELYSWNKAEISTALEECRRISVKYETPEPTPEHRIPTMFFLSHALPQAIPNISLTAPEGAYPTMDFNTFKVLFKGAQGQDDLRVLFPKPSTRRKHRVGQDCVRCCEAAWANAYFTEGMRGKKRVDSHEGGW